VNEVAETWKVPSEAAKKVLGHLIVADNWLDPSRRKLIFEG